MMKNAVWMAFERQRELEGLEQSAASKHEPITMLEAEVVAADEASPPPSADHHSEADSEASMGSIAGVPVREERDGAQGAEAQAATVKLRRRNDNFYEDYLHRGSAEHVAKGLEEQTPLRDMDWYQYGMWVRIVPGDPWNLRPHQYAFDDHYTKFETHVQELRPAPAVPFIHGFTMPAYTKDEKGRETNACFKQLLLRPHRCRGPSSCSTHSCTDGFCERRLVRRQRRDEHGVPELDEGCRLCFEWVRSYSFVIPWRRFEAQQLALAEAADGKIHASRQYPVIFDTTLFRSWWLPGAVQGGVVHDKLAPMLRRVLPSSLLWTVLRFAGHVVGEDDGVVGVAGNQAELARVREYTRLTQGLVFISPEVHDNQLTLDEYVA